MQRSMGVTAQQRLMVRCIGKYPGLTAGQLASLLHLDPGTVSATLRRLEAKRLLERRRDARDKRRTSIGLTSAGRSLDRPAEQTVEAAVSRLLSVTDPRELEATKRVLDALTSLLEARHA
jgi:DNA-binding MarR family transcriptional regulator